MFQFADWFRRFSRAGRSPVRKLRCRRRQRLVLEILEDRCLLSNSPLLPIPIHAIQAADSNGQFAASIAPYQVKQWVDKANDVYASAGVQFYFNPADLNSFSTVNNDLINQMMGDKDPNWNAEKAAANAAAANYPGQMVVIFRYGLAFDQYTHQRTAAGGGFSSTDYNFVVMPGFTDSQEVGHYLAHEGGHYLGLNHTFPVEFPAVADAQIYFAQHGYNPAVFDGDGLSDTPPDPLVKSNEHITPPSTLTLKDSNGNDVVFQLPTTNIMSYYNTPTKMLTQQQADIVRKTAVSRGLNQIPSWAQLVGTTLSINGNVLGANATESLTIDTGVQGILAVSLNGNAVLFLPGQVTAINVNSLGSNNTLAVSPAARNLGLLHTAIAINVGGNTTLTVDDDLNAAATTYTVTANGLTPAAGAPGATISYGQLAGLTLLAGSGNDRFTLQSTPAATPFTLATGTGTNAVNVAGSSGPVFIYDGGTDTVNVGTAQMLDGINSLTVVGDGSTVLTVNDQANPTGQLIPKPSTQYTLNSSSLTRAVSYPSRFGQSGTTTTMTISYGHLKTLTLNAGNKGPNTVNVESTSIPTYINGGTATSRINVAPTSQDLDNIAAFLSISGGSASVNVYDQANRHGAASGTPTTYSLGAEYVNRYATFVKGSKPVQTSIFALPVKDLTLYTSQSPNIVGVVSQDAYPLTIISGAADTITVSALSSPLTVDAHGGTVTLDDTGLADSVTGGDTTDIFTVGFTVTDQAVVRKEHWHEVEIIDQSQVPPNPASPPSKPKKTLVTTDLDFTGTLNYKNVKSLTISGGQVDTTFNVQSTPTGMPVRISGSTGIRPPAPGISGGSTANQFIVGANGSVKNIRSQLTLNGNGPKDTLLVDDSLATTVDKVTVTATQLGAAAVDQFFGAGGSLTYGSMSSLTLNLSKAANDKVQLAPSAVTAFFINANGSGAELDLDLTGVTNAQETLNSPGTGKFTFGNRQAVNFKNLGTVKTL